MNNKKLCYHRERSKHRRERGDMNPAGSRRVRNGTHQNTPSSRDAVNPDEGNTQQGLQEILAPAMRKRCLWFHASHPAGKLKKKICRHRFHDLLQGCLPDRSFSILFPFAQTPKAKARLHFEFPVMPVADSIRKDAAG